MSMIDSPPRHSSLAKKYGTDIPKSALDNAPHENGNNTDKEQSYAAFFPALM
jgi:hypothetical protein